MCLFWYSPILEWVPSMKWSTVRCWYFFSITHYDQVYLPLNLSLGLAFLVLVIRAVHYFTQPDQREKVMKELASFAILPMLQIVLSFFYRSFHTVALLDLGKESMTQTFNQRIAGELSPLLWIQKLKLWFGQTRTYSNMNTWWFEYRQDHIFGWI